MMKVQQHLEQSHKYVSSLKLLSLVMLAVLAADAANAQSLAFLSKNYDARSNSYSVRTADFNGDGKSDLVVANSGTKVSVFIGNGDGTFRPAVRTYVTDRCSAVLVADLNGDGKLDLGVTSGNWFYFLPGRGDGTFGFATPDVHTDTGESVAAGDFDGDGKIDLAGRSSESVRISFGNGNGTFREQLQTVYPVGGDAGTNDLGSASLAVADFDHDGKLDLATANVGNFPAVGKDVSVLMGNGNGTFRPMVNYALGAGGWSLIATDLNRDGNPDLAVTTADSNTVSVLLGNGDGTFRSAGSYAAGKSPRALAAADFDGDGNQDLAATIWECVSCGGRLSILPGNGDGTFRRAISATASPKANAQSIITGDFDADGKPDIAVGNNGYLSVLNNGRVFTANPMDTSEFFVRQHYYDFLQRDPDEAGLAYWTAQINDCNGEPVCVQTLRTGVSAAFFVEQEFQETSSFIYRFYRAAFNRRPAYDEFGKDRGRFVGDLEFYDLPTSKQRFADWWIERSEFRTLYPPAVTNSGFVNLIFNHAGLTSNVSERQFYTDALNNGATRANVLKQIVEIPAFKQREYNASFVLAQYFGYLRRDPDQAGYDFWLNVLNSQPNNYRGMVCSFITSAEYQLQFSPVVTHSNAECGP